jgi:hypothetical protein
MDTVTQNEIPNDSKAWPREESLTSAEQRPILHEVFIAALRSPWAELMKRVWALDSLERPPMRSPVTHSFSRQLEHFRLIYSPIP